MQKKREPRAFFRFFSTAKYNPRQGHSREDANGPMHMEDINHLSWNCQFPFNHKVTLGHAGVRIERATLGDFVIRFSGSS